VPIEVGVFVVVANDVKVKVAVLTKGAFEFIVNANEEIA
jgi:hypothetical protein